MGHYECRVCGEYMMYCSCNSGTTETPQELANAEAERAHRLKIAEAKRIIADDHSRWVALQKALRILDEEKIEYIYKGEKYNEDII